MAKRKATKKTQQRARGGAPSESGVSVTVLPGELVQISNGSRGLTISITGISNPPPTVTKLG